MRTEAELAETLVELADDTDPADLRVLAGTSDAVEGLERFGLAAGEGPGLDADAGARPGVNVPAAERCRRWPGYTARAHRLGICTVHAVPMRSRCTVIGALTLFGVDDVPLDATAIVVAQSFADVATIAILQHRAIDRANTLTDQLNGALVSRVVLEQAKGIVAGRVGLTMEDAFRRLRMPARNHNLGLVDVATDIISGALPTLALDPLPVRRPGATRRRRHRVD